MQQEVTMARVKGVKEKLHSPIYDSFFVPPPKDGDPKQTFKDFMTDPRVIRFFVDVQNKTRLETNMQAAGVLPSLNFFEARAMRVVLSNVPTVMDRDALLNAVKSHGSYAKEHREAADAKFVDAIEAECKKACSAAGAMMADLIYNSVTTLLVGEKIMIEMPTYFFPAGAGVSPGNGAVINHGEPDPMATFRFSEPVIIEPQQAFRVEMQFPREVPDTVKAAKGPLRIWTVLDGYLTRDVQ
jgi:hypothetical protein